MRFANIIGTRRCGFTNVKTAKGDISNRSFGSMERNMHTRVRRLGTCKSAGSLGRAYMSGHFGCIRQKDTVCMR